MFSGFKQTVDVDESSGVCLMDNEGSVSPD
jgi:hypothetical protein